MVAVFFTVWIFAGLVQAGDFEDGMAAYERQDYATALAKWRSAAQRGNRSAQALIGTMYLEGEGVAQNYKEAVRWYKLAAQQGDTLGQFSLGFMYANGQGVAQDYKEAVRWYKLAAKQNKDRAQYNLAIMYYEGKGVPQDYVRAHMWFNIAAAADGNIDSAKKREITASTMTAQQVELAQRMARECMASNFKKCD